MIITPIHCSIKHSWHTKDRFGAKGIGLIDMAQLNLPVPPGFIISLAGKTLYEKDPTGFYNLVEDNISLLEESTGYKFGDSKKPLLVSVRSGSPISMPGMMDTFLNVGINDETLKAIEDRLEDPVAARDIYLKLIETYSQRIINFSIKHPENDNCFLLTEYKKKFQINARYEFPQNVYQQLWQTIKAVWKSWDSDIANAYRCHQGLDHAGGTAVIVQAMVFGNLNHNSGTGVLFTRNPSTGENHMFGEYLPVAQGENLVSGVSTPYPITFLETNLPEISEQLFQGAKQLEFYYSDMQDIEFTVENECLWFLQTRSGKRTANAAFKIAYDMINEGKISINQGIKTIDPLCFSQLLHPQLQNHDGLEMLGKGLPASPGTATGILTLDANLANSNSILLLPETTAEDMQAMMKSSGIITLKGGMTSHAAVVMRGLGKPCIVTLANAALEEGAVIIGGKKIYSGDVITIDGNTGLVFTGKGNVCPPVLLSKEVYHIIALADDIRNLRVFANAETVADIKTAQKFGAEGIGLARTEHMMFSPSTRLPIMQKVIMAITKDQRCAALEMLLPLHEEDFYNLLKELGGKQFTVRLLDPPLHEFLPTLLSEQEKLAAEFNISLHTFNQRLEELQETNPMLGLRGCRLGISFPEIYAMQAKALFNAAAKCMQDGISVQLAILIPFVMDVREFLYIKNIIQHQSHPEIFYQIGTMIEIPRAALLAQTLAPHVDFISFGTNDLTQMTWGLSRDDSGAFFKDYKDIGINDPFDHFDEEGVGQLVASACRKARQANPSIKLSVCGEHGADPKAITFFHKIGIDCVSCSPWKIPTAKIAAAQATIDYENRINHVQKISLEI